MSGHPGSSLTASPIVGEVEANSPAAQAGLVAGDKVLSVNGSGVSRWQEIAMTLLQSPERPVALNYERGGKVFHSTITPKKVVNNGIALGDAGLYPKYTIVVQGVIPGSPALNAGILAGDEIRSVNEIPVVSLDAFIGYIAEHPSAPLHVEILRDDIHRSILVVPENQNGKGKIGVEVGYNMHLSPKEAFISSAYFNASMAKETFFGLGRLIREERAPKETVMGPVGIAQVSGDAARRGIPDLLYLIGLLSMSVGLINALPIPLLDGGHMAILSIESAIRRDLSQKTKGVVAYIGFALILSLMLLGGYADLSRIFSK